MSHKRFEFYSNVASALWLVLMGISYSIPVLIEPWIDVYVFVVRPILALAAILLLVIALAYRRKKTGEIKLDRHSLLSILLATGVLIGTFPIFTEFFYLLQSY